MLPSWEELQADKTHLLRLTKVVEALGRSGIELIGDNGASSAGGRRMASRAVPSSTGTNVQRYAPAKAKSVQPVSARSGSAARLVPGGRDVARGRGARG